MQVTTLERALQEAQNFIERAKKVQHGNSSYIWASKESSALRRTSMELTRALADLRQDR